MELLLSPPHYGGCFQTLSSNIKAHEYLSCFQSAAKDDEEEEEEEAFVPPLTLLLLLLSKLQRQNKC